MHINVDSDMGMNADMDEKKVEYTIQVKDVSKMYKLFDRKSDRVKDSLGFTRKKRYREHYALNHVSFSIKRGECVGIIGTNGAGKSTILKIITGVLSPTDGEVDIDGRISALLELGAGFNNEYTGIENVYLNGTMLGFTKEEIDDRLDAIIDFADIGDFINQPVKIYSSGMFVRLAFSVAINIDPEILIVDEALSVGDAFFQSKCYKKFEEFKKAGKTILFVSHDLSSIQKYCDRAILLNKGNKIGEGAPGEMINLYKKALVGQLDSENTSKKMNADSKNVENCSEEADKEKKWMSHYNINPSREDYGDGMIRIDDFAIIDQNGIYTSTIMKGDEFQIKVRLVAEHYVEDPISSYTFKTVRGTDITGTNTMFEKRNIGPMYEGDVRIITFKQRMSLQGGNYLISLGSTRFEGGEFKVSNRLYDICKITVVSDQDTVGYYDMDSEVTVEEG